MVAMRSEGIAERVAKPPRGPNGRRSPILRGADPPSLSQGPAPERDLIAVPGVTYGGT